MKQYVQLNNRCDYFYMINKQNIWIFLERKRFLIPNATTFYCQILYKMDTIMNVMSEPFLRAKLYDEDLEC